MTKDLLAELQAETSAYCRHVSELVYLVRIRGLRLTLTGLGVAVRSIPTRDRIALHRKHGDRLGYRWGQEMAIDGERWAEVEIVPMGEGNA